MDMLEEYFNVILSSRSTSFSLTEGVDARRSIRFPKYR